VTSCRDVAPRAIAARASATRCRARVVASPPRRGAFSFKATTWGSVANVVCSFSDFLRPMSVGIDLNSFEREQTRLEIARGQAVRGLRPRGAAEVRRRGPGSPERGAPSTRSREPSMCDFDEHATSALNKAIKSIARFADTAKHTQGRKWHVYGSGTFRAARFDSMRGE